MNSFKIVLLALLLFATTICHGQNRKHIQEKIEDRITDSIARLPEIMAADNYCQKLSKGKRHLVTFIWGSPTKDENYYLVKVAEDNGAAFHAWFLFAVYPGTYKIYYLDTSNGKLVPLQKWRKNFNLKSL